MLFCAGPEVRGEDLSEVQKSRFTAIGITTLTGRYYNLPSITIIFPSIVVGHGDYNMCRLLPGGISKPFPPFIIT
jgi:hypothetical protein